MPVPILIHTLQVLTYLIKVDTIIQKLAQVHTMSKQVTQLVMWDLNLSSLAPLAIV